MIPVESGALRDSMTRTAKAFPPHVMVGKVWPKKSFTRVYRGKKRRPFNYAHLVEGGHDVVRGGNVVGHVAPQPFIRDAFAITKGEQARRFTKSFLRGAQREWAKATKGPKTKRRVA